MGMSPSEVIPRSRPWLVPAVVQQTVDVAVPAVERGVRLQIALALAAAQAAVVPHSAGG